MKKILFSFALALVSPVFSKAQAIDTLVYYNQQSQPAALADYNYTAEEVNGALEKKFLDAKFPKAIKVKDGFFLYKGVLLPEIALVKLDIYTKVMAKGTSNSDLFIMLSKGYDNFISKTTDPEIAANTLVFMNGFNKNLTAYRYSVAIEKESELIKELDKRIKKTEEERLSLEKSKSKAQSKIGDLQQKSDGLKIKFEIQQKALEDIRTKKVTLEEMAALKKEVSKQEDATSKARKKHEESLKDIQSKNLELEKMTQSIADKKGEQERLTAEVQLEKQKQEELKLKLAAIQ